ncbi:MAG: glycoside hydrolase family 130 protein [Spirosomataceae bacterium]
MNKTINSVLSLLTISIISVAQSVPAIPVNTFTKPAENPILRADSSFIFFCPVKKTIVKWQKADVFNPAAIVKDGKVFLLYRCEDNPAATLGGRTSRLGLAESTDGIHFKKHPAPVLYPDNDDAKQYDYPGGCEDPRLSVTEDGLYVVAYTSWNYQIPRLSIAFSKDLEHWEKKGPAFAKAHNGKFLNIPSKSGSIVTKMKNGKQVIAKINGKYWMYWGELLVNLAWSENLHDWYPLVDEKSELKAVIRPRLKQFDSHLTECGPPAIITEKGITLLYNGRNRNGKGADPSLPEGTYSVGQVIFDVNDPEKVIERSEKPFIVPTLPHEKTGQYQSGTTFAEGLVYFKGKWFLYYGTADSFVGVAVSK